MTKYLKALKLLYNTSLRRSSLAILRYGVLQGGYLRVTDQEHHLTIAAPEGAGVADVGLLSATGDLRAALAAGSSWNAADAPAQVELQTDAVPVPIACVTGITPVAGACSTALDRVCLQLVHISPTGWAEATDGHRMFRQRIPGSPIPFTIDPLTLKLIDTLPPLLTCMVGTEYLFFIGEGWMLFVKRDLDPYPDVEKIIPRINRTPAIQWGAADYKTLRGVLTSTKIYWSSETNLVKFADSEIIIRNKGLNYCAATQLGFRAFDNGGLVLGTNAKYLLDLLTFVGNRHATVTAGTNKLCAIIWDGEDFMALQMPLRCLDKDGKQTRDGALGADYDRP